MPGFEPGTSATRTQRSTGLSHTPDYSGTCRKTDGVGFTARGAVLSRVTDTGASRDPGCRSSRTHDAGRFAVCVGSNGQVVGPGRPCPRTAFFNGRGGIRTHAGVSPHDFQSCALSHSATRPVRPWNSMHDQGASKAGSGMELASLAPLEGLGVGASRNTRSPLESNPLGASFRNARGFERTGHETMPSTHTTRSFQRREWDSNPRGP